MYDTATPRIASYLIIRREGKIAFVLRENTSWMNGFYGLPSGRVEKGESFSAAAIREGKEEVGITIKLKDLKFIHAMHRNQETDWFDIFFEAEDFSGEPHNAEPHMHSELAWLDPKKLPENVLDYTKVALEKIEARVNFSEYGFDS